VLEEIDADSGPEHNLPPAVNAAFLPVVTDAGQLVLLPHESLPYRFSADGVASATLAHHGNSVVVNGLGTGLHQSSSWQYITSGAAVNGCDYAMSPAADLEHNSSAETSRRFNVNYRQQNATALMRASDNTAQTVSHFSSHLLSVFM